MDAYCMWAGPLVVRQQMKLGFSIIEWSKSSENVDALSRKQNK